MDASDWLIPVAVMVAAIIFEPIREEHGFFAMLGAMAIAAVLLFYWGMVALLVLFGVGAFICRSK